MDFIMNGQGHGSVASRLLAANMNPAALRTNTTLRHEEWQAMDKAVLQTAKDRLVGFNDLISRGLAYDLEGNGMASTVLTYEDVNDVPDAVLSMDGVTRGQNDGLNFSMNYLPLPITHKDCGFTARALAVSRNGGSPLDTTHIGLATKKVAEKVETVLFNGASSYTFGGGTLRGYTDFPSRVTGSLGTNWAATAATGSTILDDVINMLQDAQDKHHYGPFILYVPSNFSAKLEDDFKAASDRTIRERLMAIDAIADVKVADKLTASNVVLVEMSSDTVRAVVGMQPTVVQWETQGGMEIEMKVMAILVPQIRADQEGNCGVIHYS